MRYFYDLEFLENGETIDLISIGIVAEDGREYYAVNSEAPWSSIREHAWLMANVVPHLPAAATAAIHGFPVAAGHPVVKQRWKIAHEVSEFIRAAGEDRDDHELWAYYSAYDHVGLCQLWGRMIDLPPWVPMFTHDLQSVAYQQAKSGMQIVARPKNAGEHNALADAHWNLDLYNQLNVTTLDFLEGQRHNAPDGYVLLPEPTAARLIERMLSEGPNEGISAQEEAELRAWWEGYSYPQGEPEAGDGDDHRYGASPEELD